MYKMIGNEATIGTAGWRTHWMDVKLVTSDNEALILKEPENKFYLKLKCSSNKFSN
jgi:hypothetical protein